VQATATFRIGTAGWALPRDCRDAFPEDGSNLQRYASRFGAVEINSSFYRPHRRSTWERWAASVPDTFRFAVKMPKTITHERRLVDAGPLLDDFLAQVSALGDRLGCLLVQLPPSLRFDSEVADAFFRELRGRFGGGAAVEPRHESWFEAMAGDLLARHGVARVAADPARVPEAALTGGFAGLAYVRLHGSPRMYYSSYDDEYLGALALRLRELAAAARDVWCIFDNTAHGAAAANALSLLDRLDTAPPRRRPASS
jgi:uncharacterized protein YecE (DUF72 family)